MESQELKALLGLTHSLQSKEGLEDVLQDIAQYASLLLKTPRVSVRLLNMSRSRLMAVCRAGLPMHVNPDYAFRMGEGLLGWIAQEAKGILSGDAEEDPRFVPRPDMQGKMGSFLGAPLISGGICIGVLSAVHPQKSYFTQRHEDLLTLFAGLCAPHVEIARLKHLSRVDPLTGTLNRRGLEGAFPRKGLLSGQEDPPLSLLMVDVDHFKNINDVYGHGTGDEVLRRVAGLLAGALRSGDTVIRYGGEEFLVILEGVNLELAQKIAERAREAVEKSAMPVGAATLQVTISIGVAQRRPEEERDPLIERTDAAMYAAKQAGRNRVEVAA